MLLALSANENYSVTNKVNLLKRIEHCWLGQSQIVCIYFHSLKYIKVTTCQQSELNVFILFEIIELLLQILD